jgi:transposase
MKKLALGIDCGKSHSTLFGLEAVGVIALDHVRICTFNEADWRAQLEKLGASHEIHAAFEVGPHYEWLYDLLAEYCASVEVINAADFAVICKSHKKTDKNDAQKLAEGILRGDLPAIFVPDKATREDRRLVSFVHFHSQQLSKVKSRIRGLLETHRRSCPQKDVLGVRAQAWLEETAKKIGGADALMLRHLVEQGRLLIRQRAELDGEVSRHVKRHADAELIQSVPGFGDLTALAVLSAVAEIVRFKRPEQLASYFGLCGKVHQSGQTLWQGPLSKRGNAHVRWLMSQALLHVHRKDGRAKNRYARLKKKKPRGVARGAQVRWLANVLWHVWTKKTPYRIHGVKTKVA